MAHIRITHPYRASSDDSFSLLLWAGDTHAGVQASDQLE
jgi:hypothetical protein